MRRFSPISFASCYSDEHSNECSTATSAERHWIVGGHILRVEKSNYLDAGGPRVLNPSSVPDNARTISTISAVAEGGGSEVRFSSRLIDAMRWTGFFRFFVRTVATITNTDYIHQKKERRVRGGAGIPATTDL